MKTADTIAADLDALVAEVADRFTEEVIQGRSPDIAAYAEQHPEIAHIIRQVFPALEVLANAELTSNLDVFAVHESPDSAVRGSPDPAHPKSNIGILGDFRILRELGRGGMGVVYEAEQISLGRRIALKVLPFAAMLDRQQLARFKNEARAAATLDHPNIVAIHSVGVERGVHYYAMQLVEGQSLAQVVEQLRSNEQVGAASRAAPSVNVDLTQSGPARLAGPTATDTAPIAALSTLHAPNSSLPAFASREYFRTIAQLGIQAAEALDHAHASGVLHRDIKPANLLIECRFKTPSPSGATSKAPSPLWGGLGRGCDAAGGPGRGCDEASHLKLWITDFGLARIEQDAGLTMTGDILGTLRYMSPEQALAKRAVVDHRSDIYSLGITLYELLTLQPAFTGDDRQELLRQIAFEEPRKPRQINARIPQDFETIVLKAIEKRPDDRYATAHELAHDLSQFVQDRPINARRPNMRQRLTRWSRRNQGVVAVAAGTMAFLLVASSIATAIVWQEKGRTQVALEEMSKQKTVATEQQALAEQSAAESKALVKFLVDDLLSAVDPQIAQGREVTVAEVLAQAEEKIDAVMREQPLLEASIRHAMAKAYRALAKEDEAERHLRRALEIRSRELGTDRLTLKTQLDLALCLFGKGRVDDAHKLVQENLETCVKVLGSDDQDTMEARSGLAMVLTRREQYDEAGELWRMDLDWSRRTLGPEHPDTLITMYNLAFLSEAQERYDEARKIYEQVLEIERRTLGPDHLDTLTTEGQLAGVLRELGQHDEALKWQEHILEVTRRVYGPEHIATAAAMNALATTMGAQGNYNDEARRMDEKAVEIAYRGRYWNELNEFTWNCAGRARLPDGRAKLFYLRSIANSHLQSDEGRRWAPGLYAAALEIMGDSPESEELRQLREEAASLLDITDEELRRYREGAAKEFKKNESAEKTE